MPLQEPSVSDAPPLDVGLQSAEAMQRQGKLEDAAALLLRLWEAYPDSPHASARGSSLLLHLRELDAGEALIEQGLRAFPSMAVFYIEHARAAELRKAIRTAACRWELVRARFPAEWQGYASGAAMLRALDLHTAADRVLSEGIERLAPQFELNVEFARSADRLRNRALGVERWAMVQSAFPAASIGHVGLAAALREAERFDEAKAILRPALDRWPSDRDIRTECAKLASAQGLWVEEAREWEAVRACDPHFWPAWTEGAIALRRADRNDQAAILLREAVDRFPAEATPVSYLGRVQDALGDWAAAVETWGGLRQRFPHLIEGHLGQAIASRMLGRLAEAEAALAEANQRFPNDRDVILEQVNLAYDRADWPAAAAACSAGAQQFPADNEFRRRGFEIHLRSVDAAAEVGSASVPAAGGQPDERDLLMRFESLGGTGHGCEFGIYQRECGAEPLGLLRWTDLGHEQLSDAIETEFDGVGTPEQTLIFVPETNLRQQYWTRDRRFYMVSGTSVFLDEVSEEKLFPQLCRRLQFLRRKMIDDLRAGEKIFVYKNMFRNLTEAELDRLHTAMRRYGNNTLFVIRYADETHPDGTVEWDRPGLMLGYIDHFTSSPTEEFLGKPYDSFHRLTHAAHDLWQAERR